MMKSRKPDAAELNAGDDFHVLWTIRKSLELLNFSKEGHSKGKSCMAKQGVR